MPVVIWTEQGTRQIKEFPYTDQGYLAAQQFAEQVGGRMVDDSSGLGLIEAGLRSAGSTPTPSRVKRVRPRRKY